jgi:hypothetical protein
MKAHKAASLKYQQPVCRAIAKYGWEKVTREVLVARIGIKFSDEHRAKLSAARKGKIVHLWSDESRKKASESRKRMLANKVAEKCQ